MSKKKTILFTHGGGRFANQLTNHAHFIAFAEENRRWVDVINFAFIPYAGYFRKDILISESSDRSSFFRRILHSIQPLFLTGRSNTVSILNQVIRVMHFIIGVLPGCQSLKIGIVPNYIKYLYGKRYDAMDLQRYFEIGLVLPFTIIAGWPIRSWDLFKKHQRTIQTRMKFNDTVINNVRGVVSPVKGKHSAVVGVFIRQSDYALWQNGKYFFSYDEYLRWIFQVRQIMSDRSVGFIIVTESELEIANDVREYVYHLKHESGQKLNFAESMAVLSMCDYVMTPPSTFGIWAAFLGNIPVIPVYEQGQTISQSQFLMKNLFDAVDHPHMSVALQ